MMSRNVDNCQSTLRKKLPGKRKYNIDRGGSLKPGILAESIFFNTNKYGDPHQQPALAACAHPSTIT
jgi:hypothetical protein